MSLHKELKISIKKQVWFLLKQSVSLSLPLNVFIYIFDMLKEYNSENDD